MKKLLRIVVLGLGLLFNVSANAEGNLEGFLNAIEKSKEAGFTIDPESTAREYGYKNFDSFVKDYKNQHEIKDLTSDEVREVLLGVDRTIEIVESQENLDKLYYLIMNDKYFMKYQKKKNSYFKSFKKGKYKKDNLDQMALAVYINYEKEMAKITQNPNLKKISRFAWDWGWSRGAGGSPFKWALKGCEKEAKKYKLIGGECIVVDHRRKNPDKIVNYLKPKLKNTEKAKAEAKAKTEAKAKAETKAKAKAKAEAKAKAKAEAEAKAREEQSLEDLLKSEGFIIKTKTKKEEPKVKTKNKKSKSKVKKETTEPEDIIERLKELKGLYEDGNLTKEQYEKAKNILLYKNY